MRYEPIGYIAEYEISALIFLIVVMFRYFGTRRFPNQKNRMFALILWVVMADMMLDVVSSYFIDNVFSVPIALIYAVNIAFYSLQIVLPVLMTLYVLAMVEKLDRRTLRRIAPLLFPGILLMLMLFSTPLTHWFFYVDPHEGYVHGSFFIYTYVACFFYMIGTFALAARYRDALRKVEYDSICWFLAIVLLSIAIQYMYPALLISGVAMALAVILMYFTIQNPENMIDTTTGAFTADAMLQFLHDRMRERQSVRMTAIKIRNMSRVNELLGIENGSLLLRELCNFLQCGDGGTWVFRMRGSSFVAITGSDGDYKSLQKRTDARIGQPWLIGDTEILLHATVCYVASDGLPEELLTPQRAVNYIEKAFMQNERSPSRIKTVTVGAGFVDELRRRQAVETALREAIETGRGLEPYFQPIWSLRRKRFLGAEVLLRFIHPELGTISPGEFVPIAESCGLVTAMDELVLRKACAFISENRQLLERELNSVEVNLSALEFMSRRLPALLRDILSEYDIPPSFLCFEITETAATESFELLSECMGELVDCGCSFALDDFGTGYANISQVVQLPFSVVKLDRSLLLGSASVLEDLAGMFARMGLRTVVEGVETAEQARLCAAIHADYIQGFYYARPMSRGGLLAFLRERADLPLHG